MQFTDLPTTCYLFTLSKYDFEPLGSGLIVGESGFQFAGHTVNRIHKDYHKYYKKQF